MKEKKQIIISILVLLITIFAILGVFIKEENFFLNNYKKIEQFGIFQIVLFFFIKLL